MKYAEPTYFVYTVYSYTAKQVKSQKVVEQRHRRLEL